MLLEAEFLAIVLVLVYVGAVMVLFLFVVMMLDINLNPAQGGLRPLSARRPAGRTGMAAQLFMLIWSRGLETQVLPSTANPEGYSNTKAARRGAVHRATCTPSRSPDSSCWWPSLRRSC
jgi:NADH-quinone oxidoreductase subunit J